MSRIIPNTLPAERERSCRFAETFRSEADVNRNNGVVNGAPVFDGDGIVLNGSTDYIDYSSMVTQIVSRMKKLTIAFWVAPAFDTDLNSTKYFFGTATGGNNYYLHKTNNASGNVLKLVLGGTTIADIPESTYSPYWLTNQRNHFAISSNGSLTNFWLNGVNILLNDPSVWTPKMPVNFDIGADGAGIAPLPGTFYDFKVFGEALEEQEILDLYNETTYDYPNRALVYLPMQAAQDDQTNKRTLDVSGNGNHATFGDGTTPSTYPTKLTKRGYSFDGVADFLDLPIGAFPGESGSMFFITSDMSDVQVRLVGTQHSLGGLYQLRTSYVTANQLMQVFFPLGDSLRAITGTRKIDFKHTSTFGFTWERSGSDNIYRIYQGGEDSGIFQHTESAVMSPDQAFYLMRWGSNYATGNMHSAFITQQVLTPMQVADLHVNMIKSINRV